MKPKNHFATTTLAKLIALSVSSLAASFTAQAATQTWDGTDSGVWDTSALNWGGAAFTTGNDALFTGTPTNNVTAATGLTIGAITLDNTYTGSVAMTGNNTVTGATTISGGTLAVLHTGATTGTVTATDLGTSAITVNNGGTFTVDDAGNGTTAAERILALGNNISGTGTINAKASELHTSGWSSINFTGDLSGFTGTLNVVTPATANRGKVKFTTASQATLLSSSATVDVQNGAQLYLTQALNYGFAMKLNGGTGGEGNGSLRLDAANLNVTGPVTLQADSAITANQNATISGAIGQSGGTFGFTKQGAGTLTVSNANNYGGTTKITGGTLSAGSNSALGTGTVAFNGGTLAASTNVTLSNDLSTTSAVANLNASGGTMVLNGNITGANSAFLTPSNKITLAGTNSFATSAGYGNLTVNAGAGGVDITGSTSVGNGNSADSGGYLDIHGTTTVTVQSGGSLSILGTTHTNKPGAIVGQNAAGTSTLLVNGGSLTLGGNLGWAFGNNVGTAIGVLTVSSGTATITAGSATLQNTLNFVALGRDAATGIINLDGGTLATGRQFVRDGSSGGTAGTGTATFNFNGGILQAQADQTSGNGWFETATTGNFQVVTTTVKAGGAKIDTSTFTTNINTVLAHDSALGGTPDGGLTKSGSGTLVITGANTYTGDTTVTAGVLAVSGGNAIADTGNLVITGGKVDPSGSTEVVNALYFGAAQQAAGTWGATGSAATHTDDTHFTGTGVVSVTTGPAGYSGWATTNAGGQAANLDYDLDGVSNGVEYFMNAAAGFTANPAPDGTKTVTWPNGAGLPVGDYGTQYVVQKSTDLVTWTPVPNDGSDTNLVVTAGSVSYTINGADKQFIRLVVTPN